MGRTEERRARHRSPEDASRHSRRDDRRHRARDGDRSPQRSRKRRSRSPENGRSHRRSPADDERPRRREQAAPPADTRREVPPRPDTRALDKSIDAPDFAEFRRLKRLRLAEDAALTIWPRSPSPELEPLLAEDDSAAAAAPGQPAAAAAAATEVVAEQDPEAAKLDQAELALFMEWLQERKDALAQEREMAARAAEAARPVGPTKPGTAADGDAEGGGYGGNLQPGEGERMGAFAKAGARIPRRGEIGMSDEEIAMYEREGYVLSGSRHSRMNAVRMRKENQVYTAEEKAALAMFNKQEAERKEAALIANMQALVQKAVADVDAPPRGEGA